MSDRNKKIIEEFRANNGVVESYFNGRPLLILHTTGAKTGQEHINPAAAFKDGDNLYIIASKGGAPDNPDWYHNIVANPIVRVEYGSETFQAKATVAEEPERSQLYAKAAEQFPIFKDYPQKTDRVIPVIILSRIS